MNLKVLPPEDTSNFKKICAVGQIHLANTDADFPSGPNDTNSGVTSPLMVE